MRTYSQVSRSTVYLNFFYHKRLPFLPAEGASSREALDTKQERTEMFCSLDVATLEEIVHKM